MTGNNRTESWVQDKGKTGQILTLERTAVTYKQLGRRSTRLGFESRAKHVLNKLMTEDKWHRCAGLNWLFLQIVTMSQKSFKLNFQLFIKHVELKSGKLKMKWLLLFLFYWMNLILILFSRNTLLTGCSLNQRHKI